MQIIPKHPSAETGGQLSNMMEDTKTSHDLGPDHSPLNVNGAAQLSNILQQINSDKEGSGPGENSNMPR